MGKDENVEIGTAKAVSLSYPKTINQADLKFTIHQNTPYKAPIIKGQELGTLNIIYKNKIKAFIFLNNIFNLILETDVLIL